MAHNEQVIAVEVYTEEHHKHSANPLYINAVTRYAVIFDSEAAGSCGAECRAQRVKKRHFSGEQKQYIKKSKYYIQYIKYHGGIAHFWYELTDIGARAFRH